MCWLEFLRGPSSRFFRSSLKKKKTQQDIASVIFLRSGRKTIEIYILASFVSTPLILLVVEFLTRYWFAIPFPDIFWLAYNRQEYDEV